MCIRDSLKPLVADGQRVEADEDTRIFVTTNLDAHREQLAGVALSLERPIGVSREPGWRIDDDEVVPRISLLRGHDQEAYDVLLLERSPVTVGAQAVQRVVDSSGG